MRLVYRTLTQQRKNGFSLLGFEKSFILLLSLQECLFEQIGICHVLVPVILDGLRKELTLAVGESNGQSLRFRFAFRNIRGSIPYPTAVAAHIRRKLHVRNDCITRSASNRYDWFGRRDLLP